MRWRQVLGQPRLNLREETFYLFDFCAEPRRKLSWTENTLGFVHAVHEYTGLFSCQIDANFVVVETRDLQNISFSARFCRRITELIQETRDECFGSPDCSHEIDDTKAVATFIETLFNEISLIIGNSDGDFT